MFKNTDRANLAFRHATLTADHRQEPARVGIFGAAHVEAEPNAATGHDNFFGLARRTRGAFFARLAVAPVVAFGLAACAAIITITAPAVARIAG